LDLLEVRAQSQTENLIFFPFRMLHVLCFYAIYSDAAYAVVLCLISSFRNFGGTNRTDSVEEHHTCVVEISSSVLERRNMFDFSARKLFHQRPCQLRGRLIMLDHVKYGYRWTTMQRPYISRVEAHRENTGSL